MDALGYHVSREGNEGGRPWKLECMRGEDTILQLKRQIEAQTGVFALESISRENHTFAVILVRS
eukprot:3314606-Amphidinium_carterae.1